jgi:ornithine cyclodeaminase
MKTYTRDQIETVLPSLQLVPALEKAFDAYSAGGAVIPPVGELLLERGEVHIKYGYLREQEYYVVKIASGFYRNAELGLPSGNGLMLLFRQETGELASVLLDEGRLTDVRTAAAGAVAAKHMAPDDVQRIGVAGTGVQARLQLEHLAPLTPCRSVLAWGRGEAQLAHYREDMETLGFQVETTTEASSILASCNLVVTVTPSREPLLHAGDLRPGTHITAVGSDTIHKQELDPAILKRADVVVADSLSQCRERGEIHQALGSGHMEERDIRELGDVIAGRAPGRTSADQITVADLTGVAIQDAVIASAVHRALSRESSSPAD